MSLVETISEKSHDRVTQQRREVIENVRSYETTERRPLAARPNAERDTPPVDAQPEQEWAGMLMAWLNAQE